MMTNVRVLKSSSKRTNKLFSLFAVMIIFADHYCKFTSRFANRERLKRK